MDCFIDSNVWLYAFIEGQDVRKTRRANALIEAHRPAVSSQVVNEVCVNLIRKAGFVEAEVREVVASFYEWYPVCQLSEGVLLRASHLRERYSLSFWDSNIASAALEMGLETLYSEDMHDGLLIGERLEVINPFRS